ncbi:MAG: secondary thiamine-phosphate synthase enzyme YjbQ [Bacillota bacterium]|nr:secondary thiamine-phosphate synthase enzyme YjbQ [Bacillota bacterium]
MIINIITNKREEFVDITGKVSDIILNSSMENGIVHVFIQHTTAGITINENADTDVVKDIINTLDEVIPYKNNYKHVEGNSHAHIKASLLGSSVTVPFNNKKMSLGTWQGIYFCEFDGPRSRKAVVSLIESK